ncbi:uncharacterized protein LOC113279955 [Papaver somniferum]|uniref:uncharacterized protein LOC113279955 n=1 Tax=Papaver somniferum TaxID=3469 RepID=UPI000E6FFC41|nr:uncharacterized protein LOC113279955 [Papaver somniferum]
MYGYGGGQRKREQWEFIEETRRNISSPWVLMGDLNIHLTKSNSSTSSDSSVNAMIQNIGLEDLGFIGNEHTWKNNNLGTGKRRSRIDMALGNAAWNSVFPSSRVLHLSQIGSDHCLIMLIIDYNQPKLWKLFKFFQTWLNDKKCAVEIAKAWSKQVQGFAAFILTKKMQFTRIALSKWNRKHFGNINHQVDTLQQQLTDIQARPHSPENTSKALEVNAELQRWHHIQYEFNKQKPTDNFLKDMDNNTKYFHTLTKRKRVRNNINSLKDKNVIEEKSNNHLPTTTTEEDNILLAVVPSNEEIFSVLKGMENWPAPGPERFQVGLYKSQWGIVGADIGFSLSSTVSALLPSQFFSMALHLMNSSPQGVLHREILCILTYSSWLWNDDCLIFTHANLTSVTNLLQVIEDFSSQSGQVINFDKSSILFSNSMDPSKCDTLSHILGVKNMDSKEKLEEAQWLKLCSMQFKEVNQEVRLSSKEVLLGIQNNRGNNPIARSNLCIPKDIGGLAFRDLEKLNHALLTKMAWRICTQSDLLCVKVLKEKYFKDEDFLHIQKDKSNSSYIWRGVEVGLKHLQENTCMEVYNGKKTRIWLDNWIINLDIKPTPPCPSQQNYENVSELVSRNSNDWNMSLLQTLFSVEVVDKIVRMQVNINDEEIVLCKPTRDGLQSRVHTINW